MISKTAKIITDKLILLKTVDDEDRELYEYGFYILLSYLYFFTVSVIMGLIFNVLFESLIFFIAFMTIRKFAGGYHAKTELRCTVITSVLLVICTASIWLINDSARSIIPLFALTVISSVVILIRSPLDNNQKPLTAEERKRYKLYTAVAIGIILSAVVPTVYFRINPVFVPLEIAVVTESLLVFLGKAFKTK